MLKIKKKLIIADYDSKLRFRVIVVRITNIYKNGTILLEHDEMSLVACLIKIAK